jgi:enoyl-CoA hydratase
MPYQNLIFDKQEHIGTVTFSRPKLLNALNRQTMDELDALLTEARNDKDLRVLVLTGAGDKAFIAGADINELARLTPTTGPETSLHGQAVLHKLETLGKPSIAAVNGFALGGGCELALACSIRLASRTAKFGQPEVKLGIIPGYGGSQRLARLCGKGVAHELCLSGEMISAEEAQRIGLVNHVYEPGELLTAAHSLAQKIAAHGSNRAWPGDAPGARLVSGGRAVWHELRDRGHARRHASISRKARCAISGQMSTS